jgi:GAF domain-containing protein
MAANKEQRWARQLAALNTIAVSMSQSLELEHMIKVALAEITRALEIEFGWVYLLEENRLILKCHAGLSDELVGQTRELDLEPWIIQKTLVRERLDEGPRKIDERRKREGIQSWLSVPIESKEEFIGCLVLASRYLDHFGAPEAQFVETVSQQLNAAVENARLLAFAHGQESGLVKAYQQAERYAKDLRYVFEQERKRSSQLAALNAVIATVSESLDLNTVLREALDKVMEVMKVEAGMVLLVNEHGELIPAIYRGLPQEIAEMSPPMKVGEGLSGKVVQSGEPMVLDDVSADPKAMTARVRGEGLKAWASVPLTAKDRVLGTLDISTRKERTFTPQDVQLLSSIGSQLGVAIENARLYEAIEEYSRTLEKKVALRTRNLAEEKSKLDAILHNIADGLLVVDTQDRLILANPVAARVLGFKLEEAIGHKDEEVLAPLLRGVISDLIHQPDPTAPTTLEIPDLTQIGPLRCWEQKDCQQSDCPAYGQAEAHCWFIPGTQCSRTGPLTPRRGSGQALRPGSGQALLRTGLVAPKKSASEKTGDRHSFDCPFYRRLPKLSIEARASTVEDERGEVLGTVIVMRDITALKEMDRLKTLFVSNVSHELRTPITIIKLTVSNFLQYYARLNNQKRVELLETIKRQADILHRLIENILTLSRLDTGKVSLKKVEFDLAAFCRILLSEFALAAAEKDISLIDDGLQEGTTVWADQERIGQVVRNLLGNAIKFTSAEGKVMITVWAGTGHRQRDR